MPEIVFELKNIVLLLDTSIEELIASKLVTSCSLIIRCKKARFGNRKRATCHLQAHQIIHLYYYYQNILL